MGLVAGAPFPDIYDWTWGEVVEFINCHNEAEKDKLRTDASMYFRTASLIVRMLGAKKGEKFAVTSEFGFLWTKQELMEMRKKQLYDQLMALSEGKKE